MEYVLLMPRIVCGKRFAIPRSIFGKPNSSCFMSNGRLFSFVLASVVRLPTCFGVRFGVCAICLGIMSKIILSRLLVLFLIVLPYIASNAWFQYFLMTSGNVCRCLLTSYRL